MTGRCEWCGGEIRLQIRKATPYCCGQCEAKAKIARPSREVKPCPGGAG